MNSEEQKKLKALFVATSMYYGQQLQNEALALYVEDLSDLSFDSVSAALAEFRRDQRIIRVPLPAIIRAKINPEPIDQDDDREAAGRILAAISRCGWCNQEQARNYIGELGWAVVQMQGGWEAVCGMVDEGNLPSFQAQWRDLAGSIRRRSAAGLQNFPPPLPKPKETRGELVQLRPSGLSKFGPEEAS